MPLSKSQITSKIKNLGHKCYVLDNKTIYIPTSTRQETLRSVYTAFTSDGGKAIKKSKNSAIGAVQVGSITILTTRLSYTPARQNPNGNVGVKNRMSFGAMIQDVIANTLKPLTIVLDGGKRFKITNVTAVQFDGNGVSDLKIMQGTKKTPLSVRTRNGSYHHKISGSRYEEFAQAALEQVTESGEIDAEFVGDEMNINTPIVFEADMRSIRELIFQDINNGFGVIGDFKPTDFKYDGTRNTLTISCHRAYSAATDLKSDDKPYFVVLNSVGQKVNDLDGIGIDLVPRRALPRQIIKSTI